MKPDGYLKNPDQEIDGEPKSFNKFYVDIGYGKYVPRALLIDLEPSIIDEVRSGSYNQLFHQD